jgi:hypothetical protein
MNENKLNNNFKNYRDDSEENSIEYINKNKHSYNYNNNKNNTNYNINYNNNNSNNNFYKNYNNNNSNNNNNKIDNYNKDNKDNNKYNKNFKFEGNFNEIDDTMLSSYVLHFAKDQAGCRYLQKKIEENPEIIDTIIYPKVN